MRDFFSESLCTLLSDNKLPVIVAFLAVLLTLSSITTGFQLDDNIHRAKMQHLNGDLDKTLLLDYFVFLDGKPENAKIAIANGWLPWWTLPELRISFFRPITVLTHWLGYRLWPDRPVVMHLHNLLWFGAMVLTAALLYRRIMTPFWIAGLAALLFAIDDAHGIPAGWLANRNALISATFGFLCLYFHDHWRKRQKTAWAVAAAPCFLLSVLSAEIGVGIVAYIIAYALFLDIGKWWMRITSILPYAVISIAWISIYRYLGFGAYGSGGYIDPGHAPLAYAHALFERLPLLLYAQMLFPNTSTFAFLSQPWYYTALFFAYALLCALFVFLLPLLKHDATARFWLIGMLLSLLPACTTMPSERLLTLASLGAMGLIAQFLASWYEKPAWMTMPPFRKIAVRFTIFVLIVVHLIAAPIMLPFASRSMSKLVKVTAENPILEFSEKENLAGKIVIFVNPPVPFSIGAIPYFCRKLGSNIPIGTYVLGSGLVTPFSVKRVNHFALEIQPDEGFMTQYLEKLFRGSTHPMQVGQYVKLNPFQVKVLSLTEDHRPLRVRFTFSRPLEDASLLFCIWQNNGLARLQLPLIGETVRLEKAAIEL